MTDSIRAVVIFYLVYMLSSQMGYAQFKKHVVNSMDNTLPVVSAIIQGEANQDIALACGKEWQGLPNLIGDTKLIRNIQEPSHVLAGSLQAVHSSWSRGWPSGPT